MRLARRMAGPDSLTAAVQAGLRGTGVASLSAGVQRLMDAYRSGAVPDSPVLASGREAAAYAAYRMPATVAATAAAWAGLRLALPGWAPASVLDFGAGTGGASWAVAAGLGAVTLTLLEQSADAIRLGQAILAAAESASLRAATWRSWRLGRADSQDAAPGRADLAVCAYVLGELSRAAAGAPGRARHPGGAGSAAGGAGHPGGPPADPGRAGPAARGRRRHRGTLPASARLPAGGRGGLVSLRRQGAALGPAPAGEGRGPCVRGREVQLRGRRCAVRRPA